MNFWEFIGYAILASTIFWSFYVFVAKQVFNHFLNKDLEKFKHGLSLEIEKFKKELHASAFEHEIRFSKLHEVRTEKIANTYRHLVKTEQAFFNLIKPVTWEGEPSKDEKIKIVNETAKEFLINFTESRIYFDEKICSKIDRFFEKVRGAWDDFRDITDEKGGPRIGRSIVDWSNLWKNVRDDLLSIRKDIEREFRSLLGVKNEEQAQGPAPAG